MSDAAVPSIGAQLDYMLMSLFSQQLPAASLRSDTEVSISKVDNRIEALELRNRELKLMLEGHMEASQLELDSLRHRVSAMEDKFSELVSQVVCQVVQAVEPMVQKDFVAIEEKWRTQCRSISRVALTLFQMFT